MISEMVVLRENIIIPSRLTDARKVGEKILAKVAKQGYPQQALFAIRLAVEEGLNNAIKHGNRFDPEKNITLTYEVTDSQAVIRIQDEGKGFNLSDVPNPTSDENLEKPYGRGIMLMNAYMDNVRFNERGNEVCMVKRNESCRPDNYELNEKSGKNT